MSHSIPCYEGCAPQIVNFRRCLVHLRARTSTPSSEQRVFPYIKIPFGQYSYHDKLCSYGVTISQFQSPAPHCRWLHWSKKPSHSQPILRCEFRASYLVQDLYLWQEACLQSYFLNRIRFYSVSHVAVEFPHSSIGFPPHFLISEPYGYVHGVST